MNVNMQNCDGLYDINRAVSNYVDCKFLLDKATKMNTDGNKRRITELIIGIDEITCKEYRHFLHSTGQCPRWLSSTNFTITS